MADFLGVDIAQEIADALSGKVREGTLHHFTPGVRTTGSLTAGTNPTQTNHTFEGFVEIKEVRRPGQIGAEQMAVLSIITNTIKPSVAPAVNDKATIESMTYEIVEILGLDPAGAMYECAVN